MRHRNSGRKLSRTPAHRKALFRNMAKALLTYGRITTTEAKAKEIRGVVEPLITLGLQNDLHARRQAYRVLGCHKLVKRLFDDIAPAYAGIPGGFTRISKLALPRKGDAAPMAVIELLKETPAPSGAADAKPKKVAKPKAAKPKEEGAEDAKKSKAAKPRATKAAAPKAARAPKAAPKSAAPKKMKIGGE